MGWPAFGTTPKEEQAEMCSFENHKKKKKEKEKSKIAFTEPSSQFQFTVWTWTTAYRGGEKTLSASLLLPRESRGSDSGAQAWQGALAATLMAPDPRSSF